MHETEFITNTSVGSNKHNPEKSKIEDCDTASGFKFITFSSSMITILIRINYISMRASYFQGKTMAFGGRLLFKF